MNYALKEELFQRKENLNKAQQQLVQRYKIHNRLVKQQRASYVKMMNGLKKDKALVIFDYSTFNEVTKFKVKILNFTVVFLGSDKEKKYKYFDYLAEAKADFRFTTIASWHHLLRNLKKSINGLKTIEAWADGGLKTKETVGHIIDAGKRSNIEIGINYFAPHHGHNLCDGHFGEY